MKIFILLLAFIPLTSFSQITFDQYFQNKTLRLDYYHTGNSCEDSYSFDELIEEPEINVDPIKIVFQKYPDNLYVCDRNHTWTKVTTITRKKYFYFK